MKWIFEKFDGDGAIYAICPKCNFHYSTTREFPGGTIDFQYKYCPMCGKYLYEESEGIEVIWNQRDIQELYDT